jgi:hypothetical protein
MVRFGKHIFTESFTASDPNRNSGERALRYLTALFQAMLADHWSGSALVAA